MSTTALSRLEAALSEVVLGQSKVLADLLTAFLARGHVLLEGVPGVAKTLTARTLANALGLSFARIQFTPDLLPGDVTGGHVLEESPKGRALVFHAGPVFTNVLLADEINRASPKTQSALLEAMQEHSVTVARTTHILDEPFLVLATQNPLESEGTYPLPEAQLDRFFFKLHVPFPGREELHGILDRTTGEAQTTIKPVLTQKEVLKIVRRLSDEGQIVLGGGGDDAMV